MYDFYGSTFVVKVPARGNSITTSYGKLFAFAERLKRDHFEQVAEYQCRKMTEAEACHALAYPSAFKHFMQRLRAWREPVEPVETTNLFPLLRY